MARMGERWVEFRDLMGRPDGKIPLGRPRHRRKNNIKIDPVEI